VIENVLEKNRIRSLGGVDKDELKKTAFLEEKTGIINQKKTGALYRATCKRMNAWEKNGRLERAELYH